MRITLKEIIEVEVEARGAYTTKNRFDPTIEEITVWLVNEETGARHEITTALNADQLETIRDLLLIRAEEHIATGDGHKPDVIGIDDSDDHSGSDDD